MLPFSKLVREGKRAIPGTLVFDGDAAQAGYAINAMCYSFNNADNRAKFVEDEEAYMHRFNLTEDQLAELSAIMEDYAQPAADAEEERIQHVSSLKFSGTFLEQLANDKGG